MPDVDRRMGGTTDTTKQAAMGATAPATVQATTDHTHVGTTAIATNQMAKEAQL